MATIDTMVTTNVMKTYQEMFDNAKQAQHFDLAKDIVIQIGSATCEDAAGAKEVEDEIRNCIKLSGLKNAKIHVVGCTGRCSLEPIVVVFKPGECPVLYQKVDRAGVKEIFDSHILNNKIVEKYLTAQVLNKCPSGKNPAQQHLSQQEITKGFFDLYCNVDFYCQQSRIALRNAGVINPESIDEYLQFRGFSALAKVLEKKDPEWVVQEVLQSNLRGRGGAGFPTGKKWQFARSNKEPIRYMICNADEGDPGAFMDRSMLESDPYSIVEGMIIAGFAIGAQQGFFYIRAEYPLAIERIEKAIKVCRERGLLGKNIFGSGFDFDLEIRLGAGAFVCGEETALIHSIEGERGQPKLRPPYPAIKGLWGKPTVINNVETLANLPAVLSMGGKEFAKIGSAKSGGTKVFALAGKVNHTGLVEVPMGTSLRDIVYNVGGGVAGGKKLKAVQTGGPAGGFIPADKIDVPIDYETLKEMGSIMGSGGMIVVDEDNCIVDVAKFYLEFTQDESCGKCTPCREGTRRMLEILEKITSGKGTLKDIDNLERLANVVSKSSLCGLGRAAPNPILSTLKEFRSEYEAHVVDKKCAAGQCKALIKYTIKDNCIGCTACARVCPVKCISGAPKKQHVIDQNICIKCGKCFEACRFNAVNKG